MFAELGVGLMKFPLAKLQQAFGSKACPPLFGQFNQHVHSTLRIRPAFARQRIIHKEAVVNLVLTIAATERDARHFRRLAEP